MTEKPLYRDPAVLGLIFLGGTLGTLLRYLVSMFAATSARSTLAASFSDVWATFAVNLLGAFLLGLITGLLTDRIAAGNKRAYRLKMCFGTGFCGAFTTYGTFIMQGITISLFASFFGPLALGAAAAYALGSLIAGFLLAWLGLSLGGKLARRISVPRYSTKRNFAERNSAEQLAGTSSNAAPDSAADTAPAAAPEVSQ
ncbi:CrcB protein [Actinobaculum suis]|uniref:Fluoride-specific ion channel FluC n=1 Tax=Actinobaculum suis TaxID=1657 RepID=A0A1G7D0D4_9ACTO|nr:CrcB family protein [Actinobaculum suis]MDY5152806.1 CrcB family protein [Actinobaculum suis]SDE44979.1 CrcB protein [Actinobaculum suis]